MSIFTPIPLPTQWTTRGVARALTDFSNNYSSLSAKMGNYQLTYVPNVDMEAEYDIGIIGSWFTQERGFTKEVLADLLYIRNQTDHISIRKMQGTNVCTVTLGIDEARVELDSLHQSPATQPVIQSARKAFGKIVPALEQLAKAN